MTAARTINDGGAHLPCVRVHSTMSAHTQNLLADGRASLCVTEAAFRGAADARVTLLGTVRKVRACVRACARV
jgi:hypothetical protein